ncbi:uncharacterized protein GGS22DRAFT_56214 [Annulohypoxylon maeteangense]|uniref:uncharacterized protein n=1 Tax=Annulohypoxylon maeteangense TaxID=1927788 RepID=UPI002007B533|nr:uncharacterized protein GGS22DRAFT_56214 [Annulohypoxylon maeteangense]KAI0881780.1 hypothetical protein GGS22DRAFT_56214 [Annulohypoxylon maeteangense]
MSSSSSVAISSTPRHVRSRTQSISSDRPSTVGHGLMSPPLSVTPEAVFIAASAASQIVTNDHDSHSESWYDEMGIEPSGETALVSQSALQLANNFVDQILFNIIGIAQSTSLAALRPAVSEVLKPKLAKDAINNADEELREYLGGGEVEDLSQATNTETPRDWDLELIWKRTRLRCMVYSSLGDMEEEDEDYHMEQEHLRGESDDIMSDIVSPAVAIFLTSILEFMGEQVLVIAGQAAFNRLRVKYEKELKEGTRVPGEYFDRLVVQELDMERVALDRTLGRLWRSWKKRIRSPSEPNYSRPFSRSSTGATQRRGSSATDHVQPLPTPRDSDPALAVQEEQDAEAASEEASCTSEQKVAEPADVPLPDSDVEATYSDEEESEDEREHVIRPKSLAIFSQSTKAALASIGSSATRTPIRRVRSLPLRKTPRYPSPPPTNREVYLQASKESSQSDADLIEKSVSEPTVEAVSTKEDEDDSAHADKYPTRTRDSTRDTPELQAALSNLMIPEGLAGALPVMSATTSSGTPQTKAEEEEIDEFAEEPEILTSSRISIGGSIGGRSSPATSESGRPAPLVHVRSNSSRSVRVIEVQSPRSPTAGSRGSSIEVPESAMTIRRVSTTPPIAEESDTNDSPAIKRTNLIIPSSFEDSQDASLPIIQPPRNPSPLRSVHSQSSQLSVPTKVSIISGPDTEGSFEEKPVTPLRAPRNPPLPTLPERSTSRPVYGRSVSNGAPSPRSDRRGSPESPKFPRPMPSESPSSTSTKFKAVRTSEDGNSRRSEDKARDFEQLIHSGETLQYTLTPENMRDIDSSSSQHNGSPKLSNRFQKTEETRLAERSRSSSIKRSASITKQTSLGSHPPTDLPVTGKYAPSISNSSISNQSKGRSAAAPQAREARIPRESLQDFADFIRSTGPPGEHSAKYNRGNTGIGNKLMRSATGPSHVGKSASVDSRQTNPSIRSNLQARDASIHSSSENSDLIDFIRRGPPSTNGNNPRIPRHVAPFRTTMDSDQLQMSGAGGGRAVDAIIPNIRNSETSTNFTETSAPSSMNSQSALLSKANKMQQFTGNNFDDDDMVPKRTRRRVRDPYAIDISDDEFDDLDMTPKPKPKKEESLIDFLNSYPPPPEPTPQPIAIPKKKSSAPNLIARLRSGGGSISKSNPKGHSSTDSRSLNSRAGNGKAYTPIVIPGADKYGSEPRSSAPAPAPVPVPMGARPMMAAAPSGRVPMKKFEPREAVSNNSRTSDLASFLRDSEPPPQPVARVPSPIETKSSGFSRMFERRKKSTAY